MSPGKVLYVVVCAAPAASGVEDLVRLAQEAGWRVCLVTTPLGLRFIDADRLALMTGEPVRSEWRMPGEAQFMLRVGLVMRFSSIRWRGTRDLVGCLDHVPDPRLGHRDVSWRFPLDHVVMCPRCAPADRFGVNAVPARQRLSSNADQRRLLRSTHQQHR